MLHAIIEKKLSSEDSLVRYAQESEKLCQNLGAFISLLQASEAHVQDGRILGNRRLVWDAGKDPQTTPEYPSKPILFSGSKLQIGI